MLTQKPSNPIPLNTLLGERYKVVASSVETAEGDFVLEGQDQVLNRKVSIVVSSAEHNDRLISNARTVATNTRSSVQILDLGNTGGRTYLVTSHTRADTLLDTLLADSRTLAASSETQEALGKEIFGDDLATGQTPYVSPIPVPAAISAIRLVHEDSTEEISLNRIKGRAAEQEDTYSDISDDSSEDYYDGDYEEYEEYPDEPDFDDEEDSRGGVWIVAIAAIILLVIGVAAVFTSLNGMVDREASDRGDSAIASASASPSATASASATASPSPSEPQKATPRFTGVTRLVPSNSSYMSDQDGTLAQTIDGNNSTTWTSYAFASANFGGVINSFALVYELQEETTVSSLTIDQVSGSGGAFTVYTNDSASLSGADEVGSGSFTGSTVEVPLDTDKQGSGIKYVIINFTSAPTLSQPIVSGYIYGARIAEVTPSNR